MPLDLPLYYAGVADEDMLDEFLAGRRELEHGQSSTMDVRRFLNVTYHQASLGKLKKVAAITTIAIVIIIVMIFTFGSPRARKITPATHYTATTTTTTKEPETQKQQKFVLATNPDMPFDLTLECRTCALVGSSGILLDSNAGSQIDSADCVFRLNTAPVQGYTRDVGRKTTVRVLSLPGLKSLFRAQTLTKHEALEYMILLGPGELLCENCTVTKVYRKLAQYFKNTKLVQVTREAYQNVRDEAKDLGTKYGKKDLLPTTRFYTLSLMRSLCPQIRLYGVERTNPCDRPDSVPLYYWDPDSRQYQCSSHVQRVGQQVVPSLRRLYLESKIFTSWAKKYHIEFFYPSRK